jgi:single heme cytochrome PccH
MNRRLAAFLALAPLAACAEPSSTAPQRLTYENGIRALVDKLCIDCHGPKSPTMAEFDKNKQAFKDKDMGPRYDTYENLMVVVNGSDTGALMRRLDDGTNTKDKKPGNMYEHLGETPEERAANLALFKRWIGGWTLKRKAEISDAERAAILAPR